jgi:hypothetical protein
MEASVELNTPYMLIPNFIIFSSIWRHPLNSTLLTCWSQILLFFHPYGGISWTQHSLHVDPKFYKLFIHLEASIELNTPYMLIPNFYNFFIHMEASIELNTPFALNPRFYAFILFFKFVPRNSLNLSLLPSWTQVFYISLFFVRTKSLFSSWHF